MLRSANRASLWLLAGIASVAGVRLLAALDFPSDAAPIAESSAQLLRICLVRELLHLPCPGCGMTRALAALARGEWLTAVRLHPFSPLLALQAVVLWVVWGARLWRARSVADRLPAGVAAERAPKAPDLSAAHWLPWIAANGAVLIALWAGRLASGELAAVLRP